jgi:hypothetical protein
MKRNSSGVTVATSSDDDEHLHTTPTCTTTRAPKVDRATDDRSPWSRTDWDGHVAAKLREKSWHTYYHMPVNVFDKLHALIFVESESDTLLAHRKARNSTRMGPIQTQVKLAATLRELFGEKRKSMCDVFKFAPTSARESFMNVIDRINSCPALDGGIYSTDQSMATLATRAFEFSRRSTHPTVFRHCVGAIDGLFIKTRQPTRKEVGNVRAYYSGFKKSFGLNMQGVCNAQCRFVGFACNTPGSTNDYVAFRQSFMYGHWPKVPEPYFYLGDCAYPLSPQCIIPHVGAAVSVEDDAFNFFHSQLRITVERSFGIFVNVFGIFHCPLLFSIATCCSVVEACVRLHNFRIDNGCQHVARVPSAAAIFREAHDRSNDTFDVLDDERYVTARPHATDAAYAAYVVHQELQSSTRPSDAARGAEKRRVLALALALQGAVRPAANVRVRASL